MINPGLNSTALRALRHPTHDRDHIHRRIRQHLNDHDGYLPFSGGKDSLVVLDLARHVDPATPIAFFDSGLEWPETYQFIAALRDTWDLNLHVIPAQPTTLELLVHSGAWDHHAPIRPVPSLHTSLITKPAARAHTLFGPGELWGVRAAESHGRAAAYATALRREQHRACHGCCATTPQARQRHGGVIRRIDGSVAFGPVWNWTDNDIWNHIARRRLPLNPVYAKLRALGAPAHALRISQILDGSQLEAGRLTWLKRGWPDLYADLCTLLPRIAEFT